VLIRATPVAASCAKKAGDEWRKLRRNERTLVLVFLLADHYAKVVRNSNNMGDTGLVASSAFEASFAGATDTPEKTVP
jgi:hypothetical protein